MLLITLHHSADHSASFCIVLITLQHDADHSAACCWSLCSMLLITLQRGMSPRQQGDLTILERNKRVLHHLLCPAKQQYSHTRLQTQPQPPNCPNMKYLLTNPRLTHNPCHADKKHHPPNVQHAADLQRKTVCYCGWLMEAGQVLILHFCSNRDTLEAPCDTFQQ